MKRLAAASLVRTRVQVFIWRRGLAWPVTLVLLLGSVAAYWTLLLPLRSTLAATQAELAREQSRTTVGHASVESLPEVQAVSALQAVLRNSPDPVELVRKMAALAQAEQVALPQGDYQRQEDVATRLVQVHVTQPVRTSYPQLRRYVESVLRTIPNASLDQVAARRENVGQARLEVRLRWSFWIQKDQAGDEGRTFK